MTLAVLIVLALATTGMMAFGTRRETRSLARKDGAVAILKDQLREVAADQDRGLITDDEAKAAKVEIRRRLLAVSRSDGDMASSRSGRSVILMAAAFMPVASGLLYLQIGAPTVESLPFAARSDELEEATQISELTARLEARLNSDETGGPIEGWVMLGQTYMRMGRYAKAAEAFEQIADREDADSSVFSRYAEALIASENGIVTPKAERIIDQAMARDPSNPAAVFYKAKALEQGGAIVAARALLFERLEASDGFYPWMETFVVSVNRLGSQTGEKTVNLASFAPMLRGERGPSDSDIAAAESMSEEDRGAFIQSMVERLAARLEEEPGDLEGWLRLMRAYAVLGNTEAEAEARRRARAVAEALPMDDPRRAAILSQLQNTGN